MKKLEFIGLVLLNFMLLSDTFSQTLKEASLTETVVPDTGSNGEVLSRKTEYDINCELSDEVVSKTIKDAANWKVYGNSKKLHLSAIHWKEFRPKMVKLVGPFEGYDNLTVEFKYGGAIQVNVDSATVGKTKWGFGKGKAVDLNVRRIADPQALYAFDYDLAVDILEHNLATAGGNFWFRSLSVAVVSTGTIGSGDEVRNGTQSSLGLVLHPFYFVGGLIYQMKLSGAYQFETAMDPGRQTLVRIINKQFKFGLEAEVPYTNYPIYKLHALTGYVRLAMPLTFSLEYLPKGKDDAGNETLARLDFRARYELAFSPYFIVQGEWHRSSFFDVPAGGDNNTSFYTAAIAQDLDAVKETLGFLKFLLGDSEEIRGKHFIFYRISSGRKAPAFQDLREQSFGFGTYF